MFYQIENDNLKKITFEQIHSDFETVGFIGLSEFEKYYGKMNFNPGCLEECENHTLYRISKIEVYDEFSYCFLRVLDTKILRKTSDRIAFFMKKNLLLCVELEDEDKHLIQQFQDTITSDIKHMTLEKFIYLFLLGFVGNINNTLAHVDNHILQLEDRLVNGKDTGNISKEAFQIKRRLFEFQSYFEELQDIGETLVENANHIFEQDSLRYLTVFTDKAGRISHNIEQLLERLVHLQEAYNAALDSNMNHIMQFFTVITAVFLPLSLIVGWYGMNFNMPELSWTYGYPAVILLCIIVVIVSIYIFRKKKWM